MEAPKTSLILLEFVIYNFNKCNFHDFTKLTDKHIHRTKSTVQSLFQWWPTLWNPFTLTIIRISLRDS